jgi:ABC-type sugar transport system substrate-binding protein
MNRYLLGKAAGVGARGRASSTRIGAGLSLLAVTALLATACGSSSSSTESTAAAESAVASEAPASEAASAPAADGADALAAAAAYVEPFYAPPTSVGTDVPVSKAPEPGRKVAFVSCAAAPCIAYQEAGKAAAEALGWEAMTLAFDGTPEDNNAKVQAAVDAGVDAIALNGVPRSTYENAAQAALEAGIPIIAGAIDDEVAPPIVAVQDGFPEFARLGEIEGNWIAVDSQCDANVLFVDLANFPIGQTHTRVASETLKEICPDAVVETIATQATDIGTAIPGIITSTLQSKPDVNYIFLMDSVVGVGLTAALREAGLEGQAKIVGANAGAENIEGIKAGSEYGYVQFSPTYFALQGLDGMIRHFNGDAQIAEWEMPHQILTAETIGSESTEDLTFNLPRDMQEQFLKLWKVQE